MKRILCVLGFILCFVLSALAAPPLEDYEASLTAFSRLSALYQEWSKPGPGYDVTLRRDPMTSLVDGQGNVIHAAGLHDGLAVQGIIWAAGDRSALIDDEFYREGDKVGPYRILTIEPDGFWARKDGQKIFVPLYEENQATPAGSSPPTGNEDRWAV